MIGSPHQGTYAAVLGMAIYWDCSSNQICRPSAAVRALVPNSPQLRALPPLPSTVPQRAIATDIIKGTVHLGDVVVPVSSATAEYTTAYKGDGKVIIRCTPLQTMTCSHGNLLKNTKVQASVVSALNEYAPRPATPTPSSTSPAPSAPTSSPAETSSASPTCTSAVPTPVEGENGGSGMMPSPGSSTCP